MATRALFKPITLGSLGGIAQSEKGVAGGIATLDPAALLTFTEQPRLLVVKTTLESVLFSTTVQDDDELFLEIGANQTWLTRLVLFVTGPSAADIKATIEGPPGATGNWWGIGPEPSVGDVPTAAGQWTAQSLGVEVPFATTTSETFIEIGALVENGAAVDNVQLKWAQNSSNAGSTRVLPGSFLEGTRIS